MTKAQRQHCNEMNHRGETLRAAVAWRWFRGEGPVMAAVCGISPNTLKRFVKTGEIDDFSKSALEMMQ